MVRLLFLLITPLLSNAFFMESEGGSIAHTMTPEANLVFCIRMIEFVR